MKKIILSNWKQIIFALVICILPIIFDYPLYMKIGQVVIGIYSYLSLIIKDKRLKIIAFWLVMIIEFYCALKYMH
jgi:hypothetical protein